MTLKENIRAILETNFCIAREELIESATTRIMEQITRQNQLEEIKAEIENHNVADFIAVQSVLEILDKHIKELNNEQHVL